MQGILRMLDVVGSRSSEIDEFFPLVATQVAIVVGFLSLGLTTKTESSTARLGRYPYLRGKASPCPSHRPDQGLQAPSPDSIAPLPRFRPDPSDS